MPAYSTQVVDPVKGLVRRFRSAFQLPTIQSKSWRPSRGAGPVVSDAAGGGSLGVGRAGNGEPDGDEADGKERDERAER